MDVVRLYVSRGTLPAAFAQLLREEERTACKLISECMPAQVALLQICCYTLSFMRV